MAQGMGTQAEPNSLSKWGRGSWASREANAATGPKTRGEKVRKERILETSEDPPPVFS